MTSLLHRASIVVVLAVMAVIGLSSCADTVTGTEDLKTETAVESIVEESPSMQASTPAHLLPAADSLKAEGDGGIPTRNSRKLVDRF